MNKLHQLLDTRDKRDVVLATIYYLAMFFTGLSQVYLAIQVYCVNTYDQLFGLLETNAIQSSFLGKLTTSLMSQFSASFTKIILIILNSMGTLDWIIVIGTILFLFMKPFTRYEKKIKLHTQVNTCLFLLVYLSLILTLMFSFMMGSLMQVVDLLHVLALVIGAAGIAYILMNGYAFFWNLLVQIPDSMSVTVEEIVEYEENEIS